MTSTIFLENTSNKDPDAVIVEMSLFLKSEFFYICLPVKGKGYLLSLIPVWLIPALYWCRSK